VVADAANSSTSALTVQLDTSSATLKAALRSWEPVLDVTHQLRTPEDSQNAANLLAAEISRVFEDESASLSHMLSGTPFSNEQQLLQLSPEKKHGLDGRTTRAFKAASSYHLTFSLFTPGASPSAWEIDEALKEYIQPLLNPLSPISKFTIDTQVQLYAATSPSISGPVYDGNKNQWSLQYSDLTGFINAAEWPLNPGIGSGPTINFVLYHPSEDRTPLLIGENDGTSWIIPQWGAVQIHNPAPGHSSGKLSLEELHSDMLIFADQLTSLLGVPPSPSSLSLRISSLARERATALILSASSTLGALSRLTLKLTSIEIPTSVAQSVEETLHRLEQACQDLQHGNYQGALENARIAETEVEKAFFEPSMVGQVYFPEEHKVAVYVPLLGPMAVPLVMSAIKELKKLKERKAKTV
jgi:phosphatidylinositol glycan class S